MTTGKRIPIFDASAPVVCTLDDADVPERVELIERMRASLVDVHRTDHGLLLRFPRRPGIEADVRRFALDEKRCCQFWGFEVEAGDELLFRWEGPPAAAELLDELHAYFEGDQPLTLLSGLL